MDGWLYAITHGVAVDRIRRDYKRDKAEQAQLDDAFNAGDPSFGEEYATAMRDALSRLGVKLPEVPVLHFLQDLSILEIAKVSPYVWIANNSGVDSSMAQESWTFQSLMNLYLFPYYEIEYPHL